MTRADLPANTPAAGPCRVGLNWVRTRPSLPLAGHLAGRQQLPKTRHLPHWASFSPDNTIYFFSDSSLDSTTQCRAVESSCLIPSNAGSKGLFSHGKQSVFQDECGKLRRKSRPEIRFRKRITLQREAQRPSDASCISMAFL